MAEPFPQAWSDAARERRQRRFRDVPAASTAPLVRDCSISVDLCDTGNGTIRGEVLLDLLVLVRPSTSHWGELLGVLCACLRRDPSRVCATRGGGRGVSN